MWETAWGWLILYSPLGLVGLWRWGVWVVKKIYAMLYRVQVGQFEGSVAVVTPVYNERPEIFQRALQSWHANGVAEIVAVIDHTDERCIQIFQDFSKTCSGTQLIVTATPGKRPALVAGVRAAHAPFVALVDSDTVWGEDVCRNALIPFQDPAVGGVGTFQSVLNPQTLAQRIFNVQLNMRYLEEVPFYAAVGGTAVRCLSGRTAFYRRAALVPLLDGLLNETFWGQPVVSGDDKRLTYLLAAAGWKATFQQTAHVYTPGVPNLTTFFKQRLRWTRNSWRADLRVLGKRWLWRHPRLAWCLVDNTLQPFTQLLSPTFFLVSLYFQQWLPALMLFAWWHVGRVIRIWPHVRRHPRDFALVPLLVVYNVWSALIKIYALFTLYQQGWITRWDQSRLPQLRLLVALPGYAATALILVSFGGWVGWHEGRVVAAPPPLPAIIASQPGLDHDYPPDTANVIERYDVQRGDALHTIAQRVGLPIAEIVAANSVFVPSVQAIWSGMVLSIPRRLSFAPSPHETDQDDVNFLRITVDEASQTIDVRGRGQVVTLGDVAQVVGARYVEQVGPGEWYVKADLLIRAGVSLRLAAPEVTWLKLKSDSERNVWLRATNGQIIIEGVKITSWDATAAAPDHTIEDGRSFIAATHSSRLDLLNAEVAFLGDRQEAGVQWALPQSDPRPYLVTGVVRQTLLHDLRGGATVRGASGMRWEENQYYRNSKK